MNDWICRFCGGIIRGRARLPQACPRCGLSTFKRLKEAQAADSPSGPPAPVDPSPPSPPQAGIRWPLELDVTCRSKGMTGTPLQGWTGNISRTGLLLNLPQELQCGTMLELTLQTAEGPVTVEGAVVWVEKSEGRKSTEWVGHGVRFTTSTWSLSSTLRLLLAERRLK